MAEYVEKQAVESDADDSDQEPASKRAKKIASDSDDEDEEEEDEEAIRKEMKGFVVDEDDDDKDKDSAGSGSDSGSDDDLSDDQELIAENLGIKKMKRKVHISDDEAELDDQHRIANQIFDDDESDDDRPRPSSSSPAPTRRPESRQRSDGEESDENDFFVEDDRNKAIRQRQNRRKPLPNVSQDALSEAQELFGLDFDLEQFYSQEEEAPEEEEDGDLRPSQLRPSKQRALLKEIEPSEIERGYLAHADKAIVAEDKPERFQTRRPPVQVLSNETELKDEAEWILERAFPSDRRHTLSEQAMHDKYWAFVADEMTRDEWMGKLNSGEGIEPIELPQPLTRQQRLEVIENVLKMMRNDNFEIPFIARYRREEILDTHTVVDDLWRIYDWDAKWMEISARKNKLLDLFKRMQQFQIEMRANELDNLGENPIGDDIPLIDNSNFDKVKAARTMEELDDVYQEFQLYHGSYINKMLANESAKKKIEQEQAMMDENDPEALAQRRRLYEEECSKEKYRQPASSDRYTICSQAGLGAFAVKFGLTPQQLGDNMTSVIEGNVHTVTDYPVEPEKTAEDYISEDGVFPTVEAVLEGVEYMVARQLSRDPQVRNHIRKLYFQRAKMTIYPTKAGIVEIDENHCMYAMKYVCSKPVNTLKDTEFLKIVQAEQQKLLTVKFSPDMVYDRDDNNKPPDDELELELQFPDDPDKRSLFSLVWENGFYKATGVSECIHAWNEQRRAALKHCMEQILYPIYARELREKLIDEARQSALKSIVEKMFNWLSIGSYKQMLRESDDASDQRSVANRQIGSGPPVGPPIMGLAYSSDQLQAAYAVVVDIYGELIDYIRLPHLYKRTNSRRQHESDLKMADLEALRHFIHKRKPKAIAIATEDVEAMRLKRDVRYTLENMDTQYSNIPIELVDNELSKVYMNSQTAQKDFPTLPVMARQALSLARRLQDPLFEFAAAHNHDEDLLCLQLHPNQDMIPKDLLIKAIDMELINRVNEVGVDMNRCLEHPHLASVLQFVGGLGGRKADHLLRVFRSRANGGCMEARWQLVKKADMGSIVYMNCAAFIKIDPDRVGEKSDIYIEVLDGTRVHPEAYDWARKIAQDAIEDDEAGRERDLDEDEPDPSSALNAVQREPEKLDELDLAEFARELARQNFGQKLVTLMTIKEELVERYADHRVPFKQLDSNDAHVSERVELFNLLTKESPDTFNIGRVVLARVMYIQRETPEDLEYKKKRQQRNRRPSGSPVPMEDFDAQAQPVALPIQDDNGEKMYQCPRCRRGPYTLKDCWPHIDSFTASAEQKSKMTDICPGAPKAVVCRLENGIVGRIHYEDISDEGADLEDITTKISPNQTINARIKGVDIAKMTCTLTTTNRDMMDVDGNFKPSKDTYYNDFGEQRDRHMLEQQRRKIQPDAVLHKRVVVHPLFQNITYREAEKQLNAPTAADGDCIVRPSTKENFLTLTWRVYKNIIQHVPIEEQNKESRFAIGKLLIIGDEIYEDLDEIIARYLTPIFQYSREIVNHRYFIEPPPNPISEEQANMMRNSNTKDKMPPLENFDYIEEYLKKKREAEPARIPYCMSPTHRQIGKFMLSYLPGNSARHEYVSLHPLGLRFRYKMNNKNFNGIEPLLAWFKQNFNNLPKDIAKDPFSVEYERLSKQLISAQLAKTPRHPSMTPSSRVGMTPRAGGQSLRQSTGRPSDYQRTPRDQYGVYQPTGSTSATPRQGSGYTPTRSITPTRQLQRNQPTTNIHRRDRQYARAGATPTHGGNTPKYSDNFGGNRTSSAANQQTGLRESGSQHRTNVNTATGEQTPGRTPNPFSGLEQNMQNEALRRARTQPTHADNAVPEPFGSSVPYQRPVAAPTDPMPPSMMPAGMAPAPFLMGMGAQQNMFPPGMLVPGQVLGQVQQHQQTRAQVQEIHPNTAQHENTNWGNAAKAWMARNKSQETA